MKSLDKISSTEEIFEYLNVNHGVVFVKFIEHQIRLINIFNLFREIEVADECRHIDSELLDKFFNISLELFHLVLKRIKNNE